MRINLLPVEERPLDSYAIRWEFIVILLGIVLLIVVTGYGLMKSSAVDALECEYEGSVEHRQILELQRKEIADLQQDNQKLEDRLDYYQKIVVKEGSKTFADGLTTVMESMPGNIWLEQFEIDPYRILINGYTPDTFALSEFLKALKNNGFGTTVKNLDPNLVGDLTCFTIEILGG